VAASQGDSERILVERLADELLSRCDPLTTEPGEFLGEQFDAGLAFVHHPIGLGGLDVSPALQSVVDDRLRSAKAKSAFLRNPIGVGLGIPVLRAHGTAEQQRRYYRPAFRTEEIWCQLFSEPGSGSDLAGLATRAVPDGDEWVVNGQKVWTSMAHVASVGMLLARTDPDRPKHEGLSFFLLDMHTPGVDVRPLKQMTGESEFNEVFLTDVRIPSANLVGDEGAGWRVSTTTLFNERLVHSGEGSGASTVGGSRIEKLIAAAADLGVLERAVVRDELVRRYMESRVIKWTNLRARDSRRAGHIGPEGSITKLFQGLYNRRLQETAVAVQGAAAAAWLPGDQQSASVVHGFLRAQGNTLEGGTCEILRNVLGERMLGLPRDPGFPSTTPWSSLPRNG
jgi:alkylation response protein AidB-like acyl-CoA dehydrogenase